MALLNTLLRGLFDLLLYPFSSLPPLVGLTVVSLVTAIGLLLAFKVTSDQERLAQVKRRIHAGLFEIRLFKDDLRAIFRAQLDILRHNLTYLRLSAVPLLWVIVPLILVFAQLQFHYGYRGLEPGQEVLVKVRLAEDENGSISTVSLDGGRPPLRLQVPAGLRLQTDGIWIPSLHEVAWRLAAEERGDYELAVAVGERSYTKSVRVSAAVVRRSPLRVDRSFVEQVLYPAEPPLPKDSPVESITVTYPEAEVWFFGLDLPWWAVFIILSIVFAFALRNRFGVTI